jgi:predicted GNAT family N-acyltransferase
MEQSASFLLLIKPSNFGHNSQTANSNSFQIQNTHPVHQQAANEFKAFNSLLQKENINTIIYNDIPSAQTPDAVFPNNWISFHHDGSIFLYPMESPNRRNERRTDIIEDLREKYQFNVTKVSDLSVFENQNKFLEGTGSIVFDHKKRVAYMAISSRSNPEPFNRLLEELNYKGYQFHTIKYKGVPVYHTNVLMTIGNQFTVLCSEAIEDEKFRKEIISKMEESNRELIEISFEQMVAFSANILEVKNNKGDPFILLSTTAAGALTRNQKKKLEQHATLLPASIPTIERHGGGSVRCMIAEIFLPVKKEGIIEIKSPATTDEFQQYYALRFQVLRQPWNQPTGSEQDSSDANSLHYMAIYNHNLAAVARLQFNSPSVAQVRYMATAEPFRGKGIGKKLMKHLETVTLENGRKEIFLQARENAVGFYKSLGFTIIEKTFLLFDEIQHYSMRKLL